MGSATQKQQSALFAGLDHLFDCVAVGSPLGVHEFDCNHEPKTPDIAKGREPALQGDEPFKQTGAHLNGVLQGSALQHLEDGQRGSAGDGVAAEGAAVGPRRPEFHDPLVSDDGAQREASADAFGAGGDVRPEAKVLRGEELSGPPETGLHLVEDQQDPMAGAQLAKGGQELRRGTM